MMHSKLTCTAGNRSLPSANAECPVCGGVALELFFQAPAVPVNAIALCDTRDAAMNCPKGRIDLGFCATCGAVSNLSFDAARVLYDRTYDNSLHFSPAFQRYADDLANHLVDRFALHGKDIIDIGCGNGEFLALLCQRGGNRGVGFDPSFIAGRIDPDVGLGVTVIEDYYSERYRQYEADLVVCRQVLEHIPAPRGFLRNVRAALAGKTSGGAFFEVPNASFVFRPEGIWDVIYEHCFYYAAGSLTRLFSRCGFEVLEVSERFNDQYICIETQAGPTETVSGGVDGVGDLDELRHRVSTFGDHYRSRLGEWDMQVERLMCEGRRIAVWGAGAKGAMFLNALPSARAIEYIVDVNPHKWGLYVPGTGHAVVAPQFLKEYPPDALIIMNPNYRDEIGQQVAAMGLNPRLVSITQEYCPVGYPGKEGQK